MKSNYNNNNNDDDDKNKIKNDYYYSNVFRCQYNVFKLISEARSLKNARPENDVSTSRGWKMADLKNDGPNWSIEQKNPW